jgi:hypothetical protein
MNDYTAAFGQHAAGNRLADAGRAAGDQDNFVL